MSSAELKASVSSLFTVINSDANDFEQKVVIPSHVALTDSDGIAAASPGRDRTNANCTRLTALASVVAIAEVAVLLRRTPATGLPCGPPAHLNLPVC